MEKLNIWKDECGDLFEVLADIDKIFVGFPDAELRKAVAEDRDDELPSQWALSPQVALEIAELLRGYAEEILGNA